MAPNRRGTAGAPGGAPAPPPLPGGSLVRNGSPAGQLVKIAVLGLAAALALWAAFPLYAAGNWIGISVVAGVTALIFYVYLSPRRVPVKYLLPGTLLLIAFQILPVLFTVSTSVTNFGDGHRGSKEEAIASIEAASVERSADSVDYALSVAAVGDPAGGELVFLLTAPDGTSYAGDAEGLTELAPGDATVSTAGRITEAEGYVVLTAAEVSARGEEIAAFAVPTGGGSGIRSSGLSAAYEGSATRAYDEECDCITDSASGAVFTADDERGVFVDEAGQRLPQGWQVDVGWSNFTKVLTDPSVNASFFGILAWNIAFAAGTVLLVFVVGLALALVMHVQGLRGRTAYRILLVLPYAMPSFAMFLLWRDMFNADFGLVNRMFGLDVDWLGDPWTARAALLLVNMWLGYPYLFLVATGALQSIPRELVQAARIDGAGAWQAFRHVTLPLLMVAMTPILVSTFAFNFNNFNAVYLMTEGGPFPPGNPMAGATDLLITYTYRLAFGGQGAQYGYAAAVSVFIFLIVALISLVSLRQSRSLEEVH
ncbi:arabinogalactan oligomer/maltooligosaccharide transport system permease protein [Spinactinospora alkalitolerans]|uniref:Maltose/maltodextrin transport system permease protein n=1 Tax=Spinactinospora alkalitolerans TaxID=687207 RepID=A0A852U0K8_9ACTN|nr:ABC transporter permease subunit [Spinactinospora alkalitolerans]NYE49087.1 arabinogalactan oligomer/maltooligosaccharide transport system permease protein [Spinactinospora alkalitolerans]